MSVANTFPQQSRRKATFRRALAVVAVLSSLVFGEFAGSAAHAAVTATSARVVDSCDQTPAPGQLSCFAQRRADLGFETRRQVAQVYGMPNGFGPDDLQSAYNLTSAAAGNGVGQRVYIVDAYDDPTAEADLSVYRNLYGLPACTTANGCFQKLNQTGATSPLPSANSGWSSEIALDLEMVSAVCPHCGITLVEADDDWDNLYTAVREATDLGAKFVSMSWGGGEAGYESWYDSHYFNATGVVYTAATGDNSYAAGVMYPATSPDVVAVGGTSLWQSSNSRGWDESAWAGTGSGCSSTEPKPAWQSVVDHSDCGQRGDSDVSAVADPNTGVAVYDTSGGSGWAVYGGTSAAAPIIAATYALAGAPAADKNPLPATYANAADLNDVTSGSNDTTGNCNVARLCTAGTGWDGPTGLGTPNGLGAFTPASDAPTTPTPPTPAANVVTLSAPSDQTSTVGRAASLQLSATDSGAASMTYSATNLPTGLSVDGATGLVSGAPTTAGTWQVTATATDDTGVADSAPFTWTVVAAPSAPAPPVSSSVCVGNAISNGGFESGSAGWRMQGATIQRNPSAAHLGTHFARLNGHGRTSHETVQRSIRIPAGCRATLRYYVLVRSSDASKQVHDKLYVSVGSSRVGTYTNRNRGSHYVAHVLNLSKYAGRTITLQFGGYENSSVATAFYVDDVSLTLSR